MREEVLDTWTQASEDYLTAEQLIGIKRYYASVFFSQQAAEKALKALYIHKLRDSPKTHNLMKLSRALDTPEEILDAALELNPEYVVTRYVNAANGVPAHMFNEKSAEVHLRCAEVILKWVEKQMK
ncbi:MAG: HEPN domain-containing protein [Anaerolineae bacterium]